MVDLEEHAWTPIWSETPIDPSELRDRSIRTRAELNVAEAENIRKVTVKYFATRPTKRKARFDYAWAVSLHGEMYCDVWLFAGQPRRKEVNMGCLWHQIPERLAMLFDDLAYWETAPDFSDVETAARLHYRAVSIHPFANGNGRWARMLGNIWLFREVGSIIEWPDDAICDCESSIRKEYICALKGADDGDFQRLLELHQRFFTSWPKE